MRPGSNWATKEQNYLWQTGSSSDTWPAGPRASGPERGPPGTFTLILSLLYCCMSHGCLVFCLHGLMCCCVFHFRAIVLWQCCMLLHVVVMLVSLCVCCLCFCWCHFLSSMALGSMISCFCLQMLLLETRLSISFQNVSVGGLNLCLWCCWCCWCRRPVVVVTVDRVFIFVGDGHSISQADSSLQCRIRVCARVDDLPFGCWARYSLDSSGSVWRFMLSMALISSRF